MAHLRSPEGSEPGYRRPVLILQNNEFNRSSIQTVIVVVLTSKIRLAEAPGNVLLPARETGLLRDSVANVSQVATINKSRLAARIGPLPPHLLRRIEEGLRLILLL